jgi:hypothetical protein
MNEEERRKKEGGASEAQNLTWNNPNQKVMVIPWSIYYYPPLFFSVLLFISYSNLNQGSRDLRRKLNHLTKIPP